MAYVTEFFKNYLIGLTGLLISAPINMLIFTIPPYRSQ
jgi:hypothetical protein